MTIWVDNPEVHLNWKKSRKRKMNSIGNLLFRFFLSNDNFGGQFESPKEPEEEEKDEDEINPESFFRYFLSNDRKYVVRLSWPKVVISSYFWGTIWKLHRIQKRKRKTKSFRNLILRWFMTNDSVARLVWQKVNISLRNVLVWRTIWISIGYRKGKLKISLSNDSVARLMWPIFIILPVEF